MTSDMSMQLSRVKANVAKMASRQAPPEHIDGYIKSEGFSVDQIRDFQGAATLDAQPEQKISALGPIDDATPDIAEIPQTQGRFGKIGSGLVSDIQETLGTARGIKEDVKSGRIPLSRAGVQAMGGVGLKTALMDLPGAAISTAYQGAKTIGDLIPAAVASKVTGRPFREVYGEALEQPGPLARGAGEVVSKTIAPVAEGVGQIVEKGYVKGDPTRARDIEGLKGLAMLGTGMAGQRASALKGADGPLDTTRPGVAGKAADIIKIGETRDRAVMDMALPDDIASRKRFASRGKEVSGVGPFKEYKKKLYDWEQRDIDNIVNLKGINPKNTVQDNINVINDAVGAESKKIINALEGKTGGIRGAELEARIRKKIDETFKTKEGRLLKGSTVAQKNIEETVENFMEILDEQPGNKGIDIYNARREMDDVIENNYQNIWDDTKATNSMKIINRAMRDATKEAIEEVAPGAGFSKSMDTQSSLLRSKSNMVPKAAKELETPKARVDRRLGEYGRMGALSAAAAAAKDVGAGLTKVTVAPILEGIDVAIRAANPQKAKWLQAYKVAIIDKVSEEEGAEAP